MLLFTLQRSNLNPVPTMYCNFWERARARAHTQTQTHTQSHTHQPLEVIKKQHLISLFNMRATLHSCVCFIQQASTCIKKDEDRMKKNHCSSKVWGINSPCCRPVLFTHPTNNNFISLPFLLVVLWLKWFQHSFQEKIFKKLFRQYVEHIHIDILHCYNLYTHFMHL